MSDHIPFDIQREILKRLPVKSLIQFRLVSKPWNSVIGSSDFITAYDNFVQTHPQRLLIKYFVDETKQRYASIIDDDTFPEHKHVPSVPQSVSFLNDSKLAGSSHGLFCLYGYYRDPCDSRNMPGRAMAVIWNPSIKKSVVIAVPNFKDSKKTVVGFGVRPDTLDPKIVKITNDIPLQVEVFTLSTGVWRGPLCSSNLFCESISFTWSKVVIGGFIYWLAYDRVRKFPLITSFNLASEEFSKLRLPDCLARIKYEGLSVSKIRESLGVITSKPSYDVWIMRKDCGISTLFTKLYNIKAPEAFAKTGVLGFRKNDEAMVSIENGCSNSWEPTRLFVYEPITKSINDLQMAGQSFSVNSYMESILLLDHHKYKGYHCKVWRSKCNRSSDKCKVIFLNIYSVFVNILYKHLVGLIC